MLNASTIIVICWTILLLYWLFNWWKVKPATEKSWRSPSNRWTFLWIIVLLLLLSRVGILRFFDIQGLSSSSNIPIHSPIAETLGLILVIAGLIIAIIARKILADNWSSNIEFKKDHKLVTSGVYKYVRHPIYTGVSFMGLGTIIVLHSSLVVLFYLIMFAFFVFKLKKEETLLLKHFPKEYPPYMKKAKALIPFIY